MIFGPSLLGRQNCDGPNLLVLVTTTKVLIQEITPNDLENGRS